jgi:hypothetical protein
LTKPITTIIKKTMGSNSDKFNIKAKALVAALYIHSIIGLLFLVLAWASGPTKYSYAVARNISIGGRGYCTAEGCVYALL